MKNTTEGSNRPISPVDTSRGPAGYDFGEEAFKLQEKHRHLEVFQSPSWLALKELLRGSFVTSSGRQYAQQHDLVVGAAILNEEGFGFDNSIFDNPAVFDEIGSWGLPPSHTLSPSRTRGQVAGVYQAWFITAGELFKWQAGDDIKLRTTDDEVALLFEGLGLERGATSSTTQEELAGMASALNDIAGSPSRTSDELALRSLKYHLNASLHWLSHNRPVLKKAHDRRADLWRNGMIESIAKSADERTLYDMILVKQAKMLETIASLPEQTLADDPTLASIRKLHDKALSMHSEVHDETLTSYLAEFSDDLDIDEEFIRSLDGYRVRGYELPRPAVLPLGTLTLTLSSRTPDHKNDS